MHPHEIADYLQQDRITVSFPECGPVSEVMAGIATLIAGTAYDAAIAKRLASLTPGRCLGYTHRTQPDGTTRPVSMVIEGPNGEWVDAPLPETRTVKVKKLEQLTSNDRCYKICFGDARLYVTAAELEALRELLCQNKQTAARAAGPTL